MDPLNNITCVVASKIYKHMVSTYRQVNMGLFHYLLSMLIGQLIALRQPLLMMGSHAPSGWGICIYYNLHWRAKFGSLPVKSHLTLNYALRVEKGGIPLKD